jgi:gamma-glutamyltranspeptidase / glutathione hydrolase
MRGMVVAPEPLAAQAGIQVMARGGNAVDAAVAAAFVQGVVNPMLCGIGGSGLLFLHHAPTNKTVLIDCSCTIGSRPLPAHWPVQCLGRSEAYGRYVLSSEENQMGYASIMVPGVVKGAWEAFRQYGSGKVSWAEAVAPAQALAGEGFEVYPYIAGFWRHGEDRPGYPGLARKMANSPYAASIYGTPRGVGERLVQSEYAGTLERIARNGGDEFYRGSVGEEMIADLERNGSLIAADDVREFEAPESPPVVGRYRGYEIRAAVSGSSSSPQLISMLQILEGFELKALGWNSPAYVDLLARAMRASFVDHLQLKCDPPYSVAAGLLRKFLLPERARYWQERIRSESIPGPQGATGLGADTTHVSVVDGEGSAVSWTHTIGSLAGAGVATPGLGFLYNNFVGHFNPAPGHWDSILPGKRGGGGSPLLLYKDGKLAMAIGAPGGSRIFTSVLQAIVNVIDHGMNMQEAVTAPRFHSEEDRLIFLEPEIPEETAGALEARGNRVERSRYMSRVQAIFVDPATGALSAGADPRGGGGQAVIA